MSADNDLPFDIARNVKIEYFFQHFGRDNLAAGPVGQDRLILQEHSSAADAACLTQVMENSHDCIPDIAVRR